MTSDDLASRIILRFPHQMAGVTGFRGETTLSLHDPGEIAGVCAFVRDALGCDLLLDITGIDNHGEEPRWTLVYELYSLKHRAHLRLKASVAEEVSELPTVSGVWRTAEWHEREIFDMLGIRFSGHPDLRRILMWEGYPYFPLRKDFPLEGKPSAVADVAFSDRAPLEGGPFVTASVGGDAAAREPRSRSGGEGAP